MKKSTTIPPAGWLGVRGFKDSRVFLPFPEWDNNHRHIYEILDLLKKRTSLGAALMISIASKHLAFVSTMVTWDNDHFKGKFSGAVLTPDEFLI